MYNPLDPGAIKAFMSKTHYLRCKSLHSFQKFASDTKISKIFRMGMDIMLV